MSDRKYDPQQPYKLWLDACADIPEADRPTFTYRRLSGRERLQLLDIWEGLSDESRGTIERVRAVFDGARIGLLGWANQIDIASGKPVEFSGEAFDLIADQLEAIELIGQRLSHSQASDDDKKKSE